MISDDYLTNEQKEIIQAGIHQFEEMYLNYRLGNSPKSKKFPISQTLLDVTSMLLQHSGIPEYEHRLKTFAEFWNDLGYTKIADAFAVRLAESRTPFEQPFIQLSDDDLIPDDSEEEIAPETKRSVAKAIRFVNVFYKATRG